MKFGSIVLLAFTFVLTNSFKPAEEIKWMGFNEGYEKALKKKKIMLVDVYTDWCGWCKVMDRETYANSEVAAFINEQFIPIKFNPETQGVTYTFEGKNYTGQELKNTISNGQIRGYPATLFINMDAKKSSLVGGFQKPNEFTKILTDIITQLK